MIKKIILLSALCCSAYASEQVLIIVGAPGSGKGYCSQFFCEQFGYSHISAGDLLRYEVDKKTEIGMQIASTLEKGQPVDMKIMQSILEKRLKELINSKKPIVIDGFGGQHKGDCVFLVNLLKQENLAEKTRVLYLNSSDESCSKRMLSRVICPKCSYVYNTEICPPVTRGKCDKCTSGLIVREQDNLETIKYRLEWYRTKMEHNYNQYKSFFKSIKIDTDNPKEAENLYRRIGNKA